MPPRHHAIPSGPKPKGRETTGDNKRESKPDIPASADGKEFRFLHPRHVAGKLFLCLKGFLLMRCYMFNVLKKSPRHQENHETKPIGNGPHCEEELYLVPMPRDLGFQCSDQPSAHSQKLASWADPQDNGRMRSEAICAQLTEKYRAPCARKTTSQKRTFGCCNGQAKRIRWTTREGRHKCIVIVLTATDSGRGWRNLR